MVHFLIVRFLLVLFSFNLIEHYHSMEKKTNFDFELELFRNLIKESNPNESKPHWLVDHQQNSWITEPKSWITKAKARNGFIFKLLGKSLRATSTGPRFDQETEIKDPMEAIKILSPKNNDRFDNWGG